VSSDFVEEPYSILLLLLGCAATSTGRRPVSDTELAHICATERLDGQLELRVGPVDAYIIGFVDDILIHICFCNIMISSFQKDRDVCADRCSCLLVCLV